MADKQVVNMGLKKKYLTMWRPDGEPCDINMSDPVMGIPRKKELLERGYSTTKPKVTAEDKRKAAAKAE